MADQTPVPTGSQDNLKDSSKRPHAEVAWLLISSPLSQKLFGVIVRLWSAGTFDGISAPLPVPRTKYNPIA